MSDNTAMVIGLGMTLIFGIGTAIETREGISLWNSNFMTDQQDSANE